MATVFFYGLFMDADLLRGKGCDVCEWSRARVDGFGLRLGKRATLAPDSAARAHGVLMDLSAVDLERLYSEPGVSAYRPITVRAERDDGRAVAAVCYVLPQAEAGGEPDAGYAARLYELGTRLGLPDDYLASMAPLANAGSSGSKKT